jgi:hypothetical protein
MLIIYSENLKDYSNNHKDTRQKKLYVKEITKYLNLSD